MVRLSTFSIAARCPRHGMFGVAVSTAVPGVGSLCPFARAGVGAVATQSWVNPYLGIDGLRLLAQGLSASAALERLMAEDPGRSVRQLGLVDKKAQARLGLGPSASRGSAISPGRTSPCRATWLWEKRRSVPWQMPSAAGSPWTSRSGCWWLWRPAKRREGTSGANSPPPCWSSIPKNIRTANSESTSTGIRWPSFDGSTKWRVISSYHSCGVCPLARIRLEASAQTYRRCCSRLLHTGLGVAAADNRLPRSRAHNV